ncbi:MAG: DMT family transporter [Kurthia sp.]|nr:DMT family transporter [Candidatus Kurthia equi]
MQGIVFAVLAGIFVATQNIFNATIGTETSTWSTAMITQAVAGSGAFIIYLCKKDDHFSPIKDVKPLYLFGGSFGAVVVATSVIAVGFVGAAVSNATLLVAQLLVVICIEAFGVFDMKKQPIARKQVIGLVVMIAGALLITM